MQLPTAKDGFLQFFRSTKAADAIPASFDSAKSWPAPEPKSNGLMLKRSTASASGSRGPVGSSLGWPTTSPFSAPMRDDAFALPRPVGVPGATSPWSPSAQKANALVSGGAALARSEVPFSRPPFLEKKSARHPGGLCRSC